MKNIRIIAISLLLSAATAFSQTTVLFPLAQMTGTTNDTTITIKPVKNPISWHSQVYFLPASGIELKTLNGSATTNLIPNDYNVTIMGAPGSWKISVSDTNVTLNAAEIGNLTVYSANGPLPGVSKIIAGTGATVSPATGMGVVTVGLQGTGSGIGLNDATNVVNGAGGVIQSTANTTFKFSSQGTNDIQAIGDARYDSLTTALAREANFENFTNTLGGSAFKGTNAFDLAGSAAAVNKSAESAGIAGVFQSFAGTNSTTPWPDNWVSDSGDPMLRIASTGTNTPIYITNGTLGAMTGTNFTANDPNIKPYVYLSVSNAQPFDVLGMNIRTLGLTGPTATNFADWGCLFLISPEPLVTSNAISSQALNLNSHYLHIGVSLGLIPGIGVILATNDQIQGVGYAGTIPQSIVDNVGGTNGIGSFHNVECRRVKMNVLTIVIDGTPCMTVQDDNLPQFWGTNRIWEFTAYDANAGQQATNDYSRNYVATIYSSTLNRGAPFGPQPNGMDTAQFSRLNNTISLKDGATVLGSFQATNKIEFGAEQPGGNGSISFDSFWNLPSISPGIFTAGPTRINSTLYVFSGATIGGGDGSPLNLGIFSTPITSPNTNALFISGFGLELGVLTNDTPAFTRPAGSLITTTNGDVYVTKAGNNVRLATTNVGTASVPGLLKVDGSSITAAADGTISATTGGSGTVTSVGLTMPSLFSVSGSPITSSGTIGVTANVNFETNNGAIASGSLLKSSGGSGATAATAGTDYLAPNGNAAALTNMPFTALSFNVASNAFTNVVIGYLIFTNYDGRVFTIGVGTNLP